MQTRWLEETLIGARRDDSIDWIVVQMHQDALSSSEKGNGSDKGIREAWLPLFDRYGVDLVLCGHHHHKAEAPVGLLHLFKKAVCVKGLLSNKQNMGSVAFIALP